MPKAAAQDDWQSELAQAQKLLEQQDYQAAIVEFEKYAVKENGLAQFTMALFFDNGWHQVADPIKACQWYEKAAHNNIPQAQLSLGHCYFKFSYQQKPEQASYWYRRALQNGMKNAPCYLGELYLTGHYVEKNTALALQLCRQGAEQGDLKAQEKLARWFFNGENVEQDLAQAYHWLAIGSQNVRKFNPESAFYFAHYYEQGLGMEVDLTTALRWYEFAASKGYQDAYLPTAALYWLQIVEQDNQDANVLAKSYLWSKAAHKVKPTQSKALLDKVIAVMPSTWQKPLDNKVDAHFKQFFPNK